MKDKTLEIEIQHWTETDNNIILSALNTYEGLNIRAQHDASFRLATTNYSSDNILKERDEILLQSLKDENQKIKELETLFEGYRDFFNKINK